MIRSITLFDGSKPQTFMVVYRSSFSQSGAENVCATQSRAGADALTIEQARLLE